jgi:hypothetical protein
MKNEESFFEKLRRGDEKVSPWTVLIIFLVVSGVILIVGSLITKSFTQTKEVLDSSVLLRVNMDFDEKHTEAVNVVNNEDYFLNYDLRVVGLEGLVSLEQSSVGLGPGERQEVSVFFENLNDFSRGVYSGRIIISSELGEISVPILIELEIDDPLVDGVVTLVPSSVVRPGDRLISNIRLYDFGKLDTNLLDLDYGLIDQDGKKVVSMSETVSIHSQLLLTRFIDLSEDFAEGDYVFYLVVDYGEGISTVTSIMNVEKESFFSFFGETQIYFFILIVIFLVFFLIFVLYNENSQEEIIRKLREQYKYEMDSQIKYLKLRQKQNESLLKTRREKEMNRQYFENLIKQAKQQANKVKVERVNVVRELASSPESSFDEVMDKKLKMWEKQGYRMPTSLRRSIPSVSKIRKEAKDKYK